MAESTAARFSLLNGQKHQTDQNRTEGLPGLRSWNSNAARVREPPAANFRDPTGGEGLVAHQLTGQSRSMWRKVSSPHPCFRNSTTPRRVSNRLAAGQPDDYFFTHGARAFLVISPSSSSIRCRSLATTSGFCAATFFFSPRSFARLNSMTCGAVVGGLF